MTAPKTLHHIENWIFDLDNTLYPADAGIQQQTDARMPDYIMRHFSVDYPTARKIQKDFYMKYGTTLSGLIQEHQIDPHHYWDYIFDIDYAALKHDLAFAEALSRLPGRKYIYTNSPKSHAQKVLDAMGVTGHFSGIFDLTAADFISKPQIQSYQKMTAYFNIDPARSLFMDDVARNLVTAAQMGMVTVYMRHGGHHPDFALDIPSDILPFIDYQTDDMLVWLEQTMDHLGIPL